MKRLSRKTYAIFRVILITLLLALHLNVVPSEEQQIEALKLQLRRQPTVLLIIPFFDGNNLPSDRQFQEALATVTSDYESSVALTIITTEPRLLVVRNIHDLCEIRATAEKENPWVANAVIMFVSGKAGPARTETHTEAMGSWTKVSEEPLLENGTYLRDIKTMGIYSCNLYNTNINDGGRGLIAATMMHEIGHYFGLCHNPSHLSFMYFRCDQMLNKWTVSDLQQFGETAQSHLKSPH